MSAGHVILALLGLVLAGFGGFILWTGTAGIEWNRTHQRSLQNSPGPGRQQLSVVGSRIGGTVLILAGLAMIGSAVT